MIAALLLLPAGATIATAADPVPEATTPTETTPTTPPAPNLLGAATAAKITWDVPASITEETHFNVTYSGAINGQATVHFAVLRDLPACPVSPLYPTQTASGTRVAVTEAPAPTTPDATWLGGLTAGTWSPTVADAGPARVCGWILGYPTSGGTALAAVDRPVTIASKVATLTAELPATARSAEFFTVKLTGTTPGSGRRALIMGEKDRGQNCADLRKAASGKRPLQSIVGLAKGNFTKSVRVRFRSKVTGPHLLCVQIVEIKDRTPEATAARVAAVGESLRCDVVQTSMSQRLRDLSVIRNRRDAARKRVSAARKQLAPLTKSFTKQRRISDRRIASARMALARAKSKAGKRKASKRLAAVRRSESRRLTKVGGPYRRAKAAVRSNERAYQQNATGVKLLEQSVARTKKDIKKYCATA